MDWPISAINRIDITAMPHRVPPLMKHYPV